MPPESSSMDQAISRAMRTSLNGLQRQTEELHQAVADLIAACSSSRPSNALPATLRSQSAAAALAASLEVLGRFITSARQSNRRITDIEELGAVELPAQEAPAEPAHRAPAIPIPMSAPVAEEPDISEGSPAFAGADVHHNDSPTTIDGSTFENAPVESAHQQEFAPEPVPETNPEIQAELETVSRYSLEQESETPQPAYSAEPAPEVAPAQSASTEDTGTFDLHSLPVEQQDMHRRANRVAKVSMQDIQLIQPDQVRLGREHRDICIRLNEEIGKARKEYERRFQPILGHGVDYFYHWMVEVLAAGDPEALGEYPYSTPALHH